MGIILFIFGLDSKGGKVPRYVVEITILPFSHRPGIDPAVLQLYPIFQDEEGRVYLRGVASLHSVRPQ